MKQKFIILANLLFSFFLMGCTQNTSSTQQTETPKDDRTPYAAGITDQQSESSKYDRTPFAVYVYDGDKEIVLYKDPNTATVNGKSGNWSTSHYGRIYEAYGGRRGPTVYVVRYGRETLVISPGEELVFFGTEDEAEQNEDKKYNWKDCEKKKLQ